VFAACGDCVLLGQPSCSIDHLWMLITEPEAATHNGIIVNLTTQRWYSDTTVVLQVGDHPFIKHASSVNYSDAKVTDVRRIDSGIVAGYWPQLAALSPDVLLRVQHGLLASPRTPNDMKQHARTRFATMGMAFP